PGARGAGGERGGARAAERRARLLCGCATRVRRAPQTPRRGRRSRDGRHRADADGVPKRRTHVSESRFVDNVNERNSSIESFIGRVEKQIIDARGCTSDEISRGTG